MEIWGKMATTILDRDEGKANSLWPLRYAMLPVNLYVPNEDKVGKRFLVLEEVNF